MTYKLSKIQVSPHHSVGKTKQSLIVGQFFFLSEELPSDIQGGHLEHVLVIYSQLDWCVNARYQECHSAQVLQFLGLPGHIVPHVAVLKAPRVVPGDAQGTRDF